MTISLAPQAPPLRSSPRPPPRRCPAPSLEAAAAGDHLRRGQAGPSIAALKAELRRRGFDPGEGERFDGRTQRAVRAFQAANGCQVDGIVGPETLGALGLASRPSEPPRARIAAAPRLDEPAPAGSQKVHALAPARPRPRSTDPRSTDPRSTDPRSTEARATTGEARATGAERVDSTPPSGPADERLRAHQARTIAIAEGELGVTEDVKGSNRSEGIDRYATTAGMDVGGEWCGYFASYAYTKAAEASGGRFAGQKKLHSVEKDVAWFAYYDYTGKASREEKKAAGERLRAEHAADGSTRRLMVVAGTKAEAYARGRGLPHEVYDRPEALPIRAGDTVLFGGHIGLVKSYDPETGRLVTIEGNTSGSKVAEKVHDLHDPAVWGRLQGFGRPAARDFEGR